MKKIRAACACATLAMLIAPGILSTQSRDILDVDIGAAESFALENSYTLKNLRLGYRATVLSYQLGLRAFFPSLALSYSDSRQVRTGSSDTDTIQAGVTLTQPVFDGGRGLKQRKLAEVQLKVKAAELGTTSDGIRDQVWSTFYNRLLAEQKYGLQEEQLKASMAQLTISNLERSQGSLLEVDYLEGAAEVQGLEIQLIDTQTSLDELDWQLKMLLGIDPEESIKLVGTLERDYGGVSILAPIDELFSIAKGKNAEITSLRAESFQAEVQYEISGLSYIPDVSLECTVNMSGDQYPLQSPTFSGKFVFSFPFETVPSTWRAGGSDTVGSGFGRSFSAEAKPLADLSVFASRPYARAQLLAQKKKILESEKSLRYSIKKQLSALDLKKKTLVLTRSTLDIEKKRLEIMAKQLELGEVKRIEYMKSQIEYMDKEISLLESVLDLVLAERQLEKTLGLGLGELAAYFQEDAQ